MCRLRRRVQARQCRYCYPLRVTDHASRFVLLCEARVERSDRVQLPRPRGARRRRQGRRGAQLRPRPSRNRVASVRSMRRSALTAAIAWTSARGTCWAPRSCTLQRDTSSGRFPELFLGLTVVYRRLFQLLTGRRIRFGYLGTSSVPKALECCTSVGMTLRSRSSRAVVALTADAAGS